MFYLMEERLIFRHPYRTSSLESLSYQESLLQRPLHTLLSLSQPAPLPPLNWIKINSDAELNSSTTTLAAVARDHRGDIVKVWSKHVKVCLPIQAEASAILWAVELAIKEQWNLVCFEGDAKACFDPLSSLDLPPDWTINTIINDIHNLARSFSCCNFVWVSRSCNAAAHATAKFGLLSSPLLYFNKGNLPEVIESVCKNDYRVCSVS